MDQATKDGNETKAATRESAGWRLWTMLGAVGLGLLVYFVFGAAINGRYLSWDDPSWILDNCTLRWLRWDTAWGIFHPAAHRYYQPLTSLSWMIEVAFGGLDARRMHVDNLILFWGGSVFLLLCVKRLAEWWGALAPRTAFVLAVLTTALFIVHPAHVESVAWCTERKDVLSFFFGTLFLWLAASRAVEAGVRPYVRDWRWWLGLLAYTCAVLAKGYVAVLAVVPPLWRVFYGERRLRRLMDHLVPLVLMVIAIWFYASYNSALSQIQSSFERFGAGERVAVVGNYLFNYAYALVWPIDIPTVFLCDYAWSVKTVLGFVIALAVGGATFLLGRYRGTLAGVLVPVLLLGAVYLAPGMGLAPLNWSARYLLLPVLLPAVLLALLVVWLAVKPWPYARLGALLGVVLLGALWAAETLTRVPVWLDDRSFYLDVIRQHPDVESYETEAALILQAEHPDLALHYFRKAVTRNPKLLETEDVRVIEAGFVELGYAPFDPLLTVLEEHPKWGKLAIFSAGLAMRMHRYALGLSLYDVAHKADPQRFPADSCTFLRSQWGQAWTRGDKTAAGELLRFLDGPGCSAYGALYRQVMEAARNGVYAPLLESLAEPDRAIDKGTILHVTAWAWAQSGDAAKALAAAEDEKRYAAAQAFQACWGPVLGATP